MRFLGTTTVIVPIVLIILTIWITFALASAAHANNKSLPPEFQGQWCLKQDEPVKVYSRKPKKACKEIDWLTLDHSGTMKWLDTKCSMVDGGFIRKHRYEVTFRCPGRRREMDGGLLDRSH